MRKHIVLTALVAAAATLLCAANAANAQYPIDASWFANRWTKEDWTKSLKQFQEQGGSIVWQRGANFRYRVGGATELMNDPVKNHHTIKQIFNDFFTIFNLIFSDFL